MSNDAEFLSTRKELLRNVPLALLLFSLMCLYMVSVSASGKEMGREPGLEKPKPATSLQLDEKGDSDTSEVLREMERGVFLLRYAIDPRGDDEAAQAMGTGWLTTSLDGKMYYIVTSTHGLLTQRPNEIALSQAGLTEPYIFKPTEWAIDQDLDQTVFAAPVDENPDMPGKTLNWEERVEPGENVRLGALFYYLDYLQKKRPFSTTSRRVASSIIDLWA